MVHRERGKRPQAEARPRRAGLRYYGEFLFDDFSLLSLFLFMFFELWAVATPYRVFL
jgi:hypothetical protein